MSLARALLLSSKHQAEAFEYYERPILLGTPFKCYRLLVLHQPATDDEKEACILHIFCVMYPDKAEGKGWGNPVIAAYPHTEQSFMSLYECQAFLQKYSFSDEEGWQPVEDD
jgi:hypothetical protein